MSVVMAAALTCRAGHSVQAQAAPAPAQPPATLTLTEALSRAIAANPKAVADFKKQSGYDITLSDPEGKLKDRRITLDTGDVTFWQALLTLHCSFLGMAASSIDLGST